MSTISLTISNSPVFLYAGRPGCVAVHRVHPKGADQVVFVMRRLRKPSLFPGDHLQCPGEPCHFLSCDPASPCVLEKVCGFITGMILLLECSPRLGHLLLHIGAVAVCAGATGDAVQHFSGRGNPPIISPKTTEVKCSLHLKMYNVVMNLMLKLPWFEMYGSYGHYRRRCATLLWVS